jgi:hypothetical protein
MSEIAVRLIEQRLHVDVQLRRVARIDREQTLRRGIPSAVCSWIEPAGRAVDRKPAIGPPHVQGNRRGAAIADLLDSEHGVAYDPVGRQKARNQRMA